MNYKSRSFVLCVIFFSVCMFASCNRDSQYDISLSSESVLEEDSESNNNSVDISNSEIDADSTKDNTKDNTENTVFVYVTGQVKNPGVYEVVENGRIYQVIELAGGFTSKASKVSMNLAESVVDGQHINVMSKSQYKAAQSGAGSQLQEAKSEEVNSQTQYTKENRGASVADDKININKATEYELMQLPGIGESKAKAIIAYRDDNGPFKSIEDIMQVSGIKEGAYEKIKTLIEI